MNALRIIFGIIVGFLFMTSVIGGAVMAVSLPKILNWDYMTATISQVKEQCVLKYQLDDKLLPLKSVPADCQRADQIKLPPDATNIVTLKRQTGVISYTINSKPYRYDGVLQDAGVYSAVEGERRLLRYNPQNPQEIDTAEYKGKWGIFTYIAASLFLALLYIWFFFLRSANRNDSNTKIAYAAVRQPAAAPGSFGARNR